MSAPSPIGQRDALSVADVAAVEWLHNSCGDTQTAIQCANNLGVSTYYIRPSIAFDVSITAYYSPASMTLTYSLPTGATTTTAQNTVIAATEAYQMFVSWTPTTSQVGTHTIQSTWSASGAPTLNCNLQVSSLSRAVRFGAMAVNLGRWALQWWPLASTDEDPKHSSAFLCLRSCTLPRQYVDGRVCIRRRVASVRSPASQVIVATDACDGQAADPVNDCTGNGTCTMASKAYPCECVYTNYGRLCDKPYVCDSTFTENFATGGPPAPPPLALAPSSPPYPPLSRGLCLTMERPPLWPSDGAVSSVAMLPPCPTAP